MEPMNEQDSSTAPLRYNTKENDPPTHQAMARSSKEQADTMQDLEDVDHQLYNLKDLYISNSKEQLMTGNTTKYEIGDSSKDDRKPSHREGSEDLFHREHSAVYSYFFENCPVAGELQELRLKVNQPTCLDESPFATFAFVCLYIY